VGREGPSTFERAGDLEEVVIVQLELLVEVLTLSQPIYQSAEEI